MIDQGTGRNQQRAPKDQPFGDSGNFSRVIVLIHQRLGKLFSLYVFQLRLPLVGQYFGIVRNSCQGRLAMSQGNPAPTKIPNLYELLKLQPKESNDQVIRSALKELAERIKRMDSTETAQQAAKLFAIAKQNLLDPQRKAAYDSLWDKVFGQSQSTEASPATARKKAAPSASSQVIAETVAKVAANASSKSAAAKKAEATDSQPKDASEKIKQVASIQADASTVPVQAELSDSADSASSIPLTPTTSPEKIVAAPSISTQESEWDLSELNALLPSGDPTAPLDLAGFLESTDINADGQRSVEDLERDFQKLFKLLGGAIADDPSTISSMQQKSSDDLFSFASQPSSSSIAVSANAIPTATAIPTASLAPTASIAKNPVKARKRRDSSLLVMIGGGITTLLLVLGFLLMMLKKSNDAKQLAGGNVPAPTLNNNAANNAANNSTIQPQDTKTKSNKPIGSGLPQPGSGLPKPGEKVGGTEEGMSADGMNAGANQMQPANPTTPPTTAMEPAAIPATNPPATNPPATSTPATNPPATTATEPAKPATPDPTGKPAENSSMTEKPNATPPMEVAEQKPVELSKEEKAAWKKQMTEARTLLGNSEFDKANELLEKLTDKAKNPDQKAQLKRLKTISPLVKHFHEALLDSLSSRGAAEQIKVDNQVISFIDFTEDKILVVKIAGQRKTFDMKEIPVKVAYAFADLKLDQSPTSAAAKAAFTAVHKKANKNNKEEARKLMQSAAAAEVVPSDAHEVFDDDYSVE